MYLLQLVLFLIVFNFPLGRDDTYRWGIFLILPLIYMTSADAITLIFGLELVVSLVTIIVLRYVQNSLLLTDIKKILGLFIVNTVGFIFLTILLLW
jgi:hypothetical protein